MIDSTGILSKISKIKQDKENIRSAIVEKDIVLDESALLSEYDEAAKLIVVNQHTIYKCISVNEENNTWSGYEGQIKDDSFVLSTELTENLQIKAMTPVPGYFYNNDASVRFDSINVDGRKNDNFCYRTFETEVSDIVFGGSSPLVWGVNADKMFYTGVGFSELPCLNKDKDSDDEVNNDYVTYEIPVDFESDSFTVSFWVKTQLSSNSTLTGVAFKEQTENTGISVTTGIVDYEFSSYNGAGFNSSCEIGEKMTSDINLSKSANNYEKILVINPDDWNHYAFIYDNRTQEAKTYINGYLCATESANLNVKNSKVYYACSQDARIAELVISNSALGDESIKWLAWKSDTATKITRTVPQIICPDAQYTVRIGENVSGSVGGKQGVSVNFEGFWGSIGFNDVKYNGSEETPDWIDYFSDGSGDMDNSGNAFSTTTLLEGNYEITGVCKADTEDIFKGTYYNHITTLEKPFKINIDVVKSTLTIEARGDTGGIVAPAYIEIKGNVITASSTLDGGSAGISVTSIDNLFVTLDEQEYEITDSKNGFELPFNVGCLTNFQIIEGSSEIYFENNTIIFPSDGGNNTLVSYNRPLKFTFDYYSPNAYVIMLKVPLVRDYEYFAINEQSISWIPGKYNGYRKSSNTAELIFNRYSGENGYNNTDLMSPEQNSVYSASFPCSINSVRIIDCKSNGEQLNARLIQDSNESGNYQIVFSDNYNRNIRWGGDGDYEGDSVILENTWFAEKEDGSEIKVESYSSIEIVLLYEEQK